MLRGGDLFPVQIKDYNEEVSDTDIRPMAQSNVVRVPEIRWIVCDRVEQI